MITHIMVMLQGSVVDAYNKHGADMVIGEGNQGGDLVEMNIRNYNRNIRYQKVTATRGKALRAEPIANHMGIGASRGQLRVRG